MEMQQNLVETSNETREQNYGFKKRITIKQSLTLNRMK